METKKAMLTVKGNSYPVYVVDIPHEATGEYGVQLDWKSMGNLTKSTKKRTFDRFIKDIDHTPERWKYPRDADMVYIEFQGILTFKDEAEGEPVTKHDHWKLVGVASRKLEEYSEEGYLLVRVEDSMGMNEGTITLHYKKKEVVQ